MNNNQKRIYGVAVSDKYINIKAGQEYQLCIIDENTDISKDFFYDVYCTAFKEVIKIVNENESKGKEDNNILETSNNIIAFCGERGQGKSSSMLSFSKILKNIGNRNINSHFSKYVEELKDKKFHILSRIDPTELENQQSILSVIISRIFHDFKEYLKCNADKDLIKKNNLLESFQQCYRDIELVKSNMLKKKEATFYEDDLEVLSNLSDSANIKNDFFELVKRFLEFTDNQDLLVIQIDDTDLNVENAYQIVEDIRKYFMIPRVIVLMATKLDQLINSISQGYMKSFQSLMDAHQMTIHDFHNMATKYIGKLIPGSRCIILPEVVLSDVSAIYNINLRYLEYDSTTDKEKILLEGYLQEKVLEYIYKKTGIIFVNPKGAMHNIIPRTARGLANFLSILHGMEDLKLVSSFAELDIEDIYLRLANIEVFEEYFLNTWIEENVDVTYINGLKNWSRSTLHTKNKLIIYDIAKNYKMYPSILLAFSDLAETLKRILRNIDLNMRPLINTCDIYDLKALGSSSEIAFTLLDVLDTLESLENYYPEAQNNKFTFSVRTLYSITLNKLILNQILNERILEQQRDYVTLFIGDIYGSKVNRFMSKERNRYDRACFAFSLPEADYSRWVCEMRDAGKVLKSLFIKTSTSKEDEKGGSVRCEYNISWLLINALKPRSGLPAETSSEYDVMRYTCFQIVSNVDLLIKLQMDLIYDPKRRVLTNNHTGYILDFFHRIEKNLGTCRTYQSRIIPLNS